MRPSCIVSAARRAAARSKLRTDIHAGGAARGALQCRGKAVNPARLALALDTFCTTHWSPRGDAALVAPAMIKRHRDPANIAALGRREAPCRRRVAILAHDHNGRCRAPLRPPARRAVPAGKSTMSKSRRLGRQALLGPFARKREARSGAVRNFPVATMSRRRLP